MSGNTSLKRMLLKWGKGLRPRPFCGGTKIGPSASVGGNWIFARCLNPDCQAEGPCARSWPGAKEAWERRVTPAEPEGGG